MAGVGPPTGPGEDMTTDPTDQLRELISTFNELNAAVVEELDGEPSPLEFMRFVARNTPFVARGAALDWKAIQEWDREFLVDAMKGANIKVAVTPRGNADAPTRTPDGTLVFATPLEEECDFGEFLDYVIRQEKDPTMRGEARYAQTQNDNLGNEYAPLARHVPSSIPFARVALGRGPDAANLWIGNSRSVTALHKDNYENVYVQVRGRKHFVLLPPLCFPVVRETPLPAATYERRGRTSSSLDQENDEKGERDEKEGEGKVGDLRLVMATGDDDDDDDAVGAVGAVGAASGRDNGEEARLLPLHLPAAHDATAADHHQHQPRGNKMVPFPTWDPDQDGPGVGPDDETMRVRGPFDDLIRPLRVTLHPGDILYLPTMWYHKVSQSGSADEDGFVLAVNYWYDMDFSGPFYPLCNMVRSVTQARQ